MVQIIAFANQKGGVGKTTTAINIGASLATIKKRVLLVDLDPQGNAGTGLGFVRAAHPQSVYGVIMGTASAADNILSTAVPGLHIMPSSMSLAGAEVDLLDMEKEMLGLYISGHPLDEYKEYIFKNSTATTIEINSSAQLENEEERNTNYDEKVVTICGIFKRGKLLITKSRKNMMFAELEDLYGTIELVLFPNIFEKYERVLLDDCIIKVTGKVSFKEDEKAKILVSNLVLIDNEIKNKKDTDTIKIKEDKKIYIRIPKDKFELEDRVIGYIKELSREYHGDLPVYIFYDGTNKLRLLNKINYLQDNNIVVEKLELAFGKENVKIK